MMHYAIKLVVSNGFDGNTLLAPSLLVDNRYPAAGEDGVTLIELGSGTIGLIDPDLSSTAAANQNLLLQSFLIELAEPGGTGASGDLIEAVDEDGRTAFLIKDLNGVETPYFDDRRWIIPVGYRLRVVGTGPVVLRLNLWSLERVQELAAAGPIIPV